MTKYVLIFFVHKQYKLTICFTRNTQLNLIKNQLMHINFFMHILILNKNEILKKYGKTKITNKLSIKNITQIVFISKLTVRLNQSNI